MGDLTDGLCGMTLGGVLRNQAMNYPKRVAVVDVDHEKRYTYEELNKRVNLLTNTLLKMGVKKGDIIGIFMRDLVEFIELMIALNKIGGIWAPCNYRFTPGEAQRQLLHSHPKMFFFEDAYVELVEEIKGSLPNIETYVAVGGEVPGYRSYEDLLKDSSEEEPQPEEEVTSEDIIGIIYTSGTTGVGKGSMHTHKSFLGWSFIAMYENSTGRHDRLLNPYPMFHMGGSIFCMTCVLAGATFYMFGKFDPLKFLKVVEEEKITVIWVVPTIVHAINSLPQEVKDQYKWSSVRSLSTSSTPFLTETQDAFSRQWPHIKLHSTYSATEVYFTNLRPEDQERKVRCVGPAVFGTEIKLLDLNREGKEVPQGELGIVYAKSISMFKGYYKNPEANKKSFLGEWLTCEDVGYLDEEGYLHLVDRAKDMVVSGGENIASVEVENVLVTHPAIFECAVIGVPDDKWGERVHAVISLHEEGSVTPEEIMEWCRDKIAGFKRPRSVDIVDEIPKNPSGKTLKRKIRDKYWKDEKVKI
ncbi:MAG: acyl--CoA ligase [Desulfobacteraceae bacterium]|nr:acyl--CoA ligase [Desulfobacteraceae bacterium]